MTAAQATTDERTDEVRRLDAAARAPARAPMRSSLEPIRPRRKPATRAEPRTCRERTVRSSAVRTAATARRRVRSCP